MREPMYIDFVSTGSVLFRYYRATGSMMIVELPSSGLVRARYVDINVEDVLEFAQHWADAEERGKAGEK